MDGLTILVAELIGSLRAALAADVCPGGWPWAVSAFGVALGLLPALGAVVVALVRRGVGSRYGLGTGVLLVGIGVVTAGLLPLALFRATGRVFTADAGLSAAQLRDLGTTVCLTTQADYLGGYTVREAFDVTSPVRFGLALFLLALLPVVTAVFVLVHARLALRRGPAWPAKAFWVPVLALPFLTAGTPAGSSGHLWLGASIGAFLGIFVVLMAGVPSHAVVARSLAPAAPPAPSPAPAERARSAAPPGPSGWDALQDRAAARFAARTPEPPVAPVPDRAAPLAPAPGPLPGPRPPAGGRGPLPPTLVAPAPPLTGAGGRPGAPRFRLVQRLGSGGFGRVWLADDHRLGHRVALKAAHAPDAETEQRIQREARALAAVRHPHCIRVHDLVAASSDPGLAELEGLVIVMEYVEGPSLGDLVRGRGLLDDIAAARVWSGIAGALDAAHGRGVMHRDVKPGNIVIDPSGAAHLIDFGIARKTGDTTMTLAGFVLGTPDFLAPEVACGERATPSSDTWQLAATISYALTGHPPRGDHPDAVSGLRAAAAGAPLTHLPKRSAHLALLQACLATDPAQRPPLRAAQHALDDWLRRVDPPVPSGARRR